MEAKRLLDTTIAIATAFGGEGFTTGLTRIMDGQCPDCGSEDHDYSNRCFNITQEPQHSGKCPETSQTAPTD